MSSFWHLDIGNIATWVVVIFSILGAARKMGGYEESLKKISEANEALTVKVERMDTHGTQWSQRGIGIESELTKSNTRRLDNDEVILARLSPEIAAIRTDLDWIKHTIQKNGH